MTRHRRFRMGSRKDGLWKIVSSRALAHRTRICFAVARSFTQKGISPHPMKRMRSGPSAVITGRWGAVNADTWYTGRKRSGSMNLALNSSSISSALRVMDTWKHMDQ